MDAMRLSRYLAAAGIGSRRMCDELIADGRVIVNGSTSLEAYCRVTPDTDCVSLDGTPVCLNLRRYYYLLNKPKGYVCSHASRFAEDLAVNLIETDAPRLFSAGRLDKQSEGLIIFSNDGELNHYIEHPSHGLTKTYRVTVHGPQPTREILDVIECGLVDKEELLKPLSVTYLGETNYGRHLLEFCLNEGKNREIRRICRLSSWRVRRLQRIAIGPLHMNDMEPGDYRDLTESEINALRKPLASS